MKKILFITSLLFFSCTKPPVLPKSNCGWITAKNGGRFFIGDGDTTINVPDSVYDAHKEGDYYCY